jgi:hypothetical protein
MSVLSHIELSYIYYLMIIYFCLIDIFPMHLTAWERGISFEGNKAAYNMELQTRFE